jgi:hypothetical protein
MGAAGTVCDSSDDAELEVRLRLWICQTLNCSKQWLQEREGEARGLKLASWSKGTKLLECESQKMLPHLRQWWRRVK